MQDKANVQREIIEGKNKGKYFHLREREYSVINNRRSN